MQYLDTDVGWNEFVDDRLLCTVFYVVLCLSVGIYGIIHNSITLQTVTRAKLVFNWFIFNRASPHFMYKCAGPADFSLVDGVVTLG